MVTKPYVNGNKLATDPKLATTAILLIGILKQKRLMSHLRKDSVSSRLWEEFVVEAWSPQGVFTNMRPFKGDPRGNRKVKEHLEKFVTKLNTLYLQKQTRNEPPLAIEKDGSELFEDLLNERVRIRREKEEAQRLLAEKEDERVRMRSINDDLQGLVPPVPVATTAMRNVSAPTTNAATTETNVTGATTNITQVVEDVVTAEVAMARGTLQVTPPTNQVVGTRRGRDDFPQPLQDTRPRQSRRTGIDDEGRHLRSCLRHQNGRVPHNDRPTNRHMDMIDQIDRGESITNMAMLQLSQTFRCDRRRMVDKPALLNSVVGFLNMAPPPNAVNENAKIYNLASQFTVNTLEHEINEGNDN